MPRQIFDIKKFIEYARRKDARAARIKKVSHKKTKFKLRCSRYLYTLELDDPDKAAKLKQSLPPSLTIDEVSDRKKK